MHLCLLGLIFVMYQPYNKVEGKGGPNGQFLRLRRLCTKDIDFKIESWSLIMHMKREANQNKSYLNISEMLQNTHKMTYLNTK